MSDHTVYVSPLASRYASKEMSYLFSSQFKHTTWRRLWLALARAQRHLGLSITEEQIHAMERTLHKIDFGRVEHFEKLMHHDVMAHIHAYAEVCPEAAGIIHLGATSCYVTDNTDQIQMLEALKRLQGKLIQVARQLAAFAAQYAAMPCLAYTHFQAAQPTTVGKRACLWLQDFLIDYGDLTARIDDFAFLGAKGATGTQASFLSLFEQDSQKVKELEKHIAHEMGFQRLFPISSQTYCRKQDARLLSVLSGLAISAHKFAGDIRLLSHLKEVEEPFAEQQVGSSAMPYKRNPIHSERVCALARFLLSLADNPAYTASLQWLERTLDDSANRRLSIPEAFLCADAILDLLIFITSSLVVHPKIIEKHLREELPFLATEHLLMEAVKQGGNRQEVHRKLREHSLAATHHIKEEGGACDLLQRLGADPTLGLSMQKIEEALTVERFTGRAAEQVREFLTEVAQPILKV